MLNHVRKLDYRWRAAMPFLLASCLAPGIGLSQVSVSVLQYGAVADGIMRTDGAMTNGSAVLRSASSSFAPSDAGKYVQVIGAGPGAVSRTDGSMALGSAILNSSSGVFLPSDVGKGIIVLGAGTGGGNLVTAIRSYTSSNSITLAASAGSVVTNAAFFYGAMTLEAAIQSVQSATAVTLSAPAQATITGAVFAYGTDNHAAFQAAVDAAGQAGGGTVSVPAPFTCPPQATCGYVIKASDQMTASVPGAVKIRYSHVSLDGDASLTNLFCRGAWGQYTNSVAWPGQTAVVRGMCLAIGDNGGPNGVAGTAVSNVTISNLHLYGMTDGNTFNTNFSYPPVPSDADGWDITHKAIYMWDNSAFSNITINSVVIQDFKAENIYSGGSVLTGIIIENSVMKNFNGNGISMLAADLQVLNNTFSSGSNAAVENSTKSVGGAALVRQLFQGNTISNMPREGIVVVGVDGGTAAGSVQILNNTFDTIAQINSSGAQAAVYIASQSGGVPPANVTISGNTCHDCRSLGLLQTSGATQVANNTFIIDRYGANDFLWLAMPMNNFTISGNTGYATTNAQANALTMAGVYLINPLPGYPAGAFSWNNVVLSSNTWTFPGTPQYQFVTNSGGGWGVVALHNLTWEGDSCTGCTHADVNHGLVNVSPGSTIEPYGPAVYAVSNGPVTVTVDASKEQNLSQVQVVNAGTQSISFVSDANLSLSSALTLPGSSGASATFVFNSSLGKYTLLNSNAPPPPVPASITATAGGSQSAVVNVAFATGLQAMVKDSGGNPLSGITVTFTAPSSGASASFSGSAAASAVTNSSGIATAPALTANNQTGGYSVIASVSGLGATASFSLTNTAASAPPVPPATTGTPALIQQAVNGGNQSSFAVRLGSTPSSSNVLIACVATYNGNTAVVNSLTGATWTRIVTSSFPGQGDVSLWVGTSPSSGSVTINMSGGGTLNANVSEWSGVSAVVDASAGSQGQAPTMTTPALATSNAADLVIGCGGVSVIPEGALVPPANGFTGMTTFAGFPFQEAYRVTSATGSYSTAWTEGGNNQWFTAIAALRSH